ncbi:lytic polysaccharide monooxygenase [Streptomyces sp. NPDC012888]|uniref:lytic polysaccharide monooxygenase auxiliary activity family 9 protein n=1 Tax=Streptomyces sp. NPDC012888 TaxID=3364855 RepID=UPI0036BC66F6
MSARRTAARRITALGLAPFAVAAYAAVPAAAHGSMTDPVSRVAACYAEGPESPRSAACKAAVAASGAQAFYDWNAVNIANAAGQHRRLVPDGKLCSAGNDKYRGLDLARGDWPASPMKAGPHTFRYKGTAPHRGSFALYVTRDGYDPSKPLKWSDLEPAPFATVTDPRMQGGDYVFSGTVPKKSGRHLIYSIWQRSDSPEAFYTCSDVVFGKDTGRPGKPGGTPSAGPSTKPSTKPGAKPSGQPQATPTAQPSVPPSAGPTDVPSAPTDEQIDQGRGKSTVEHGGHGDDDPKTNAGSSPSPVAGGDLAETGGSGTSSLIAIGGAGALAVGAAVLFGLARRRSTGGRHGR